MENIDVRDLPEEEAQLVAAFVEFLRRRQRPKEERERLVHTRKARDVAKESAPRESPFAVWPLGVKGLLSREEIYEHL